MTQHRDDDRNAFEDRAREVFERSVADLDARTRSKLTQARHRALNELDRPSIARQWSSLRPQAAAVALVVAAVGAGWLLIGTDGSTVMVEGIAEVDDVELLLGEDELELIEELEFYAWLEEQPEFQVSDDGAG